MADRPRFDPVALLRNLEEHRVGFVLVGKLAGILRGAPETTRTVEICPQLKGENLQRLGQALAALSAVALDSGAPGTLTLADGVRQFETSHGELIVEPVPDGTRGYDDLRRRATRERIAPDGLFVSIASLEDLLRTVRARELPDDASRVHAYRRLDELSRALERGHGLGL
jgi:hypothetical protein